MASGLTNGAHSSVCRNLINLFQTDTASEGEGKGEASRVELPALTFLDPLFFEADSKRASAATVGLSKRKLDQLRPESEASPVSDPVKRAASAAASARIIAARPPLLSEIVPIACAEQIEGLLQAMTPEQLFSFNDGKCPRGYVDFLTRCSPKDLRIQIARLAPGHGLFLEKPLDQMFFALDYAINEALKNKMSSTSETITNLLPVVVNTTEHLEQMTEIVAGWMDDNDKLLQRPLNSLCDFLDFTHEEFGIFMSALYTVSELEITPETNLRDVLEAIDSHLAPESEFVMRLIAGLPRFPVDNPIYQVLIKIRTFHNDATLLFNTLTQEVEEDILYRYRVHILCDSSLSAFCMSLYTRNKKPGANIILRSFLWDLEMIEPKIKLQVNRPKLLEDPRFIMMKFLMRTALETGSSGIKYNAYNLFKSNTLLLNQLGFKEISPRLFHLPREAFLDCLLRMQEIVL